MKKSVFLPVIFFFPLIFSTIAYCNQITVGNLSGFRVDYYRGEYERSAQAGEFTIQLTGFESAAYCVELGVAAGSGDVSLIKPSEYSSFDGFFTNNYNGLYAAWLMDQYSIGLGYKNDSLDKDIADAALQIAIWDTLYNYNHNTKTYDRPFDPNNPALGQYFENSAIVDDSDDELAAWALAEAYKTALLAVSADGLSNSDFSGNYRFFIASITAADGTHKQNLLVAQAIPEPTTIMLFSIGLLGIGALSRKKNI